MTPKNIWIVTELFYPDETAVAFIFTRIANHLSKSYKVSVICGPDYYDNNKNKFIDDVQVSRDIDIYRIKSINLDKNSLIQRSLKIVILSLRMGILMVRKIPKGEIVILSTNPAPLLLIVRLITYFKKIQLHILVHDVFPENTVPAKIFKNNYSFVFRIFKHLFDKAYSCADQLIVIGRDMEIVLSEKVRGYKKKPIISIVPNWTNPDKFYISDIKDVDGKKITIQYAGNLGRVQGLVEILDGFRLSTNQNLQLNFYGTGALFQYIENYISKYSIKNITLKGSYSRNEEYRILSNCDIGIVSLSKGMFGLGVPSKSYHLLSAGKPILFIGEPETEISYMVLENNIGWSLDIRNQNSIIDFFDNLNSIEYETIRKMGLRARFLAESVYNETVILQLFQSKIESLNS